MSIERLLKFKELNKLIPMSRTILWRRIQKGTFPKPIDLGGGTKNSAKAWSENDIQEWIEKQQTTSLSNNKIN